MKKFITFWIFIAVLLTCTASTLITQESDREIILTDRDRWDRGEKNLVDYPISATIKDGHSIIIYFLQEYNHYVTIQIADNAGNVIYSNTYLPDNQISIDITSLNPGIYKLMYSSPDYNLSGNFSIN